MAESSAHDDVLANLRRRIVAIESEHRIIRELIQHLERAQFTTDAEAPRADPAPLPTFEDPQNRPRRTSFVEVADREFARMTYADAASEVLRRARRPMKTKEILSLMSIGGRAIGAKDPYRSLYRVLLMKSDRFVKMQRHWLLAEGLGGGEKQTRRRSSR